MAQPPPPPPPNAGQRLLDTILNRANHGITTTLLGQLNLRDYMNLRTGLNSQILHSVDPINLLTQNRAPWVPPPPNTRPPATDYLRRWLGAQCNDVRYTANVPIGQPRPPCTNGPMNNIRLEACKHTNPTVIPAPHAPFPTGTFNVCDPCVLSWHNFTRRQVTWLISEKRSILCKSHSLSLRRRDQISRIPGCTCLRDILAGHKCHTCRLDTEFATYSVGIDRRDVLMRTHISYKEKGRKGRKTLVVKPDIPRNVRKREACPMPGCGKKPWIRHPTHPAQGQDEPEFSKHADAGLMCLCCNEGII